MSDNNNKNDDDKKTKKKTAVVIGATGYVGSAVTKALGEHGLAVRCTSRKVPAAEWLKDLARDVEVVPLELPGKATSPPSNELSAALRGTDAAFFCAGFEHQSPDTIDFMVSNALALIAAAKAEKVPVVVLTSSGGSTNPPGGLAPEIPKSEVLHFSDPDEQISRGRYSPAAKTLMERKALEAVGRNHANEIVDEAVARDPATPRLVILNPNLILGPPLEDSNRDNDRDRNRHHIRGNSLPWMVRILRKQAMADYTPNDSMSIIDVRDLAELHVVAALNPKASGRYFGVNRSYSWREILGAFATATATTTTTTTTAAAKASTSSASGTTSGSSGDFTYVPPPLKPGEDYESAIPTQFDHTRKNSLGVALRPLEETLRDLVEFFVRRGAI